MRDQSLIKVAFRQYVDGASTGVLERKIFRDTYQEFLMQVQAYNQEGKFQTLQEIIADNPKANSLHYKVGFSVGLYMNELKGVIPDLHDTLGRQTIPFVHYEFEIVASHITKKDVHKVAITYHTDVLTLFGVVGDALVVGLGDHTSSTAPCETFIIKNQPNFSITSWQNCFQEI